ncbi:MAG: glycosyltransferase family 92 protein [Verrucomicrobia bacterium]|nr:glycosyltransferase family 92 protein [Verrucomicrobiota bacterium]
MKKIFLILIILTACNAPPKYKLTVCAIFKNEAPWLKEWVTYHEKLGVQHFYLYNNDSTDHYAEVLKPFIDRGVVELIEWDSQDKSHHAYGGLMDAPWSACQLGAYNDCMKKRALGKAQWVAVIDIDEFIVPVHGAESLYDLLDNAKKKGIGSLRLFWRVFGTSNVENLAEGELLTEKLTWRSLDTHPWNSQIKSIHRPEGIKFCLVHEAKRFKKFKKWTVDADVLRVHHYWTRTGLFCTEKRKMTTSSHGEFFEALHQVEDKTILQYLH